MTTKAELSDSTLQKLLDLLLNEIALQRSSSPHIRFEKLQRICGNETECARYLLYLQGQGAADLVQINRRQPYGAALVSNPDVPLKGDHIIPAQAFLVYAESAFPYGLGPNDLFAIACDEKRIDELLVGSRGSSDDDKLRLRLSKHGELRREPTDGRTYNMVAGSNRYNILFYLATNPGYQLITAISHALGGKEKEQTIRGEISKIRKNILTKLSIEGKQVIEAGRRGSGYRIRPSCKITAE